jgi:hypothetical protein
MMDSSAAGAWLSSIGHDKKGLCKPNRSKFDPSVFNTAMLEACRAGQIGMCQWLFTNGAASTLRKPNTFGQTPFMAACEQGHICILEWLCSVGAKDDILTLDHNGCSPLLTASCHRQLRVVEWLILQGAAASQGGSSPLVVDAVVLRGSMVLRHRPVIRATLAQRVKDNTVFVNCVILPVVIERPSSAASPLALLHGHESTLLLLLADFLGILYGVKLRIARAGVACLAEH